MKKTRNSPCPCGSGQKYKHCCGALKNSNEDNLLQKLAEAINAGEVSSIQDINSLAQRITALQNAQPREEFLGLSSAQMHRILYYPFKSPELVTWNEHWLPKHVMALQIFHKLADRIGKEGIKRTKNGNLPIQLCRDILVNTPEDIFLRSSSIRTETEFGDLHVLRLIGEIAGLIKPMKTKFILSALGQELTQVKNQSRLFNCLIKAYATELNWPYRDFYPEINIIQTGWMFSLYCLSLFGHKWRPCGFYADKFLNAFPMALDELDEKPYASARSQFHHCYSIRTLKRFAYFWGLIEMRKSPKTDSRHDEYEVRAPHLSEWLQFHA